MNSPRGGGRRTRLAAVYILACFVLAVLAFVPQDPSRVFYFVLFVVMVPISLVAFFISYIGGVMIFGPGDLPAWARVAEALLWSGLAALQAFAFLALCRTRGKRVGA